MTTEAAPTIKTETTANNKPTKPRRTASSHAAPKRTSAKGRSKRKKADHRPLKVMLTAGAFLATWMGTGWMAQQDAVAAQVNQPEPVTIAYVAPDGTVSERILELEPVPQVIVTSNSSR